MKTYMLKSVLFFLQSGLIFCETIDLCADDCIIEKKLSLKAEGDEVTFEACPANIVKFKFLPEAEKDVSLTIKEQERKTFYKNGIKENIENLFSLTSSPTLSYKFPGNDASGIEIWFCCQKNTSETSDPMEYGSHTDEIILEPNSQFQFSLKSDDTYLVDIDLETTDPTSAFSAVMLGNGDYAIGFRNIRLAMPKIDTMNETQGVSIITSNNIAPADTFSYSFELGSERNNVTHRLETTTQPAVAKEKYVTVFVLAVNEQSFVDDHLEDLKTTTWKYMTDACPAALEGDDNLIVYTLAYSCRHECGMTRSEDRGCVKVGMHLENIPEATYCPGIQDQTFQEYLREQLKDHSKELKKEFGAKQVAVDGCNDISLKTEWIWVSVGLVGGVLLLSLCIMILKRRGVRTRSAETVQSVPNNEDDVEDDNGSGNSKFLRVNPNFVMME